MINPNFKNKFLLKAKSGEAFKSFMEKISMYLFGVTEYALYRHTDYYYYNEIGENYYRFECTKIAFDLFLKRLKYYPDIDIVDAKRG